MSDSKNNRSPGAEDLLAAYELGLLDDADRVRFEAATRDDPELLEELFDAAPIIQALHDDPARFAAAARVARTELRSGFSRRIIGWFAALVQPRFAVPLAISAVALVFVVFAPQNESWKDLAVLEPLAVSRYEVRAGAPAADEFYRGALDAYLENRWADAAVELENALALAAADWARTDQARLYLGSSLLLEGRIDAAVTVFEQILESPLVPIRERAAWQLVQARLVLGDVEGARTGLEGLQSSPVFGEKAEALLEALTASD